MSARVLTQAMVGHNLTEGPAPSGLWKAMSERIRPDGQIPTVEVTAIAPATSMFDYDPEQAVALTELPEIA